MKVNTKYCTFVNELNHTKMQEVLVKEEPNDAYIYDQCKEEKRSLNLTNNNEAIAIKMEKDCINNSLRSFRLIKSQNFEEVSKKEFYGATFIEEEVTTEKHSVAVSTKENIKKTIEIVIKKYVDDKSDSVVATKHDSKFVNFDSFQDKEIEPSFVCRENPLPLKCILEENPKNFPSKIDISRSFKYSEMDKSLSGDISETQDSYSSVKIEDTKEKKIFQDNMTVEIQNESNKTDTVNEKALKKTSNSNPFACPDCCQVLSSAGNLRRHVNTKHKGMKPFVCPQCELGFGEKASLEKHVMAIHDKIRPFRCSECEKSCVTKSSLVKHIQTNHDSLPGITYECSICKGDRSFSRSGFRLHWLKNHDPDPDAAAEVRKRCNERKFKCPLCPTRFASRPAVNTHVLTKHEGVRPFSCPLCTASFSSKNHIKRHIDATHKKLRPYECHMCPKSFSYKSFLQRHVSHTHMKVKEFECQLCHTCFSEKANMLRHIDMVHKQLKPFKCHVCESKYCDKAGLKHHLSSKHKIT